MATILLKNTTQRPIRPIKNFVFPEGVRVLVNLTIDYDTSVFRTYLGEPPLWRSQGEFGGRVGLYRLLDVLDNFHVPATIFLPGQTALLYPESVRRAVAGGHEIANHMWDHHLPESPEEQSRHLERADRLIRDMSGSWPRGTRSEHDVSLLRDHGYDYVSYTPMSEFPFYLYHEGMGRWLLNLPMNIVYDDAMFYYFGWFGSLCTEQRIQSPAAFLRTLLTGYEAARTGTRYMNIVLHPNLSGRSSRIMPIERFLQRASDDGDVRFVTSAWLARYILDNFPAEQQE